MGCYLSQTGGRIGLRRPRHTGSFLALAVASTLSPAICAQPVPDAGTVTRELEQAAPPAPRESAPVVQTPSPSGGTLISATAGEEAGPRFQLKAVRFTGNTAFASRELQSLLSPLMGDEVGLTQLEYAVGRVTQFYRDRGFPVARAYLPPQDVRNGEVEIAVLEGELGTLDVKNGSRVREDVIAAYLQPLQGRAVESAALERKLLLVYGLAGVSANRARLAPGSEIGQTDLILDLGARPAFSSGLQLDNYGDRYTGKLRATATASWMSPTGRGDRLSARLTYGDPDLAYGNVGYTRPIGAHGLRTEVGFARTEYTLGEELAALDASGQASTWSARVGYPIVLTARFTLQTQVGYAWRDLEDRIDATLLRNDKHSRVATVDLSGEVRDGFLGGGVTTFDVEYRHGELTLENLQAQAIDAATARTAGSFGAWRIELMRLQRLSERFSLLFSTRAQVSGQNLDSSEKFVLAGPEGVRAYAPGEASGDEGHFERLELRYAHGSGTLGTFMPFAFVEGGRLRINAEPFAAGRNHRVLSAAGLGLRWSAPWQLFLHATVAHRLGNETATIAAEDRKTRAWVQVSRQF